MAFYNGSRHVLSGQLRVVFLIQQIKIELATSDIGVKANLIGFFNDDISCSKGFKYKVIIDIS